MARYAEDTSVTSDRSKTEIEHTLARYGASEFVYASRSDSALIGFTMADRRVRLTLPLPASDDPAFTSTPTGRARAMAAAKSEREAEIRRRWRALALVIKAKLEAVETGISTFDDEFLSGILLPGGFTVGDRMIPALPDAYQGRPLPPLLPSGL